MLQRVQVIDSHTAGEPTRVVIAGGPDLGAGSMSVRRDRFRDEFDGFRSAIVNEPRGSDVLIGAILTEPHEADCRAGVLFFNNVSVLGMCGHATIGLAVTFAHLGWVKPGTFKLDTPVGTVEVQYHGGQSATVANVVSHRFRKCVNVAVPGIGTVTGDIAWGGNWFFLTDAPSDIPLTVGHAERLTSYAKQIRRALDDARITGADGQEIDHVELVGPAHDPNNQGRNFVFCPGGAYDRSPCGTGTSAKLACLAADGKLAPGSVWRQEGILGTVFEGRYEVVDGGIRPFITGDAYVTAEGTLLYDPADPFRQGIRS